MATITIEIDRKNGKGKRKVAFLVCHRSTKKRIHTEVSLSSNEYSEKSGKIKNPVKARAVEDMRRKLEDGLCTLSYKIAGDGGITASDIAYMLTASEGSKDFFEFADGWLERTRNMDKNSYRFLLNELERFVGGRRLPFTRITFAFLTDYERSMDGKERKKTKHMGLMRHLYREAMRELNTDTVKVIENDPFTRYAVPRQVQARGVRALTLEQLLAVYGYRGMDGSMASRARDVFILSFCLMGMNAIDMWKADDLSGGFIRYRRSKTEARRADGAYIEVRVHPFIAPLMERYSDSERVFNFHRRWCSPNGMSAAMNNGLKIVGEAVGIKSLQFYQARHTFATLSRNLMRFSKGDVDEALNHSGGYAMADVYIKRDFSIINDNNFRLIERVFGLNDE